MAGRPLIPVVECGSNPHPDGGLICTQVQAGETNPMCPVNVAPGYYGCCCGLGGADTISTVLPIPGGPDDPCVAPQAPGLAPTPNCIEVPNQNLDGAGAAPGAYAAAAARVCGPGGTYNDGTIGGQNGVACCCY